VEDFYRSKPTETLQCLGAFFELDDLLGDAFIIHSEGYNSVVADARSLIVE